MTLVLGIDPSLDRTGYAVLRASPRGIIEAGVIRTTAGALLPARLAELDTALCQILEEHAIARVAVEDLYAHYKHPRTAILMGHARGVILLAAAKRSIAIDSYAATRVKKSMTGNGHAGKLQMQRAVAAIFNLKCLPEPPDVADAIAIALCALGSGMGNAPVAPVSGAGRH